MTIPPRSIAIIGAGFSGTLAAIHLLRLAGGADRIYLFEKSPPFGRSVAYGTEDPNHLLNVRAGGMSAFEDDPVGFVAWLNGEAAGDISPLRRPVSPDCFAPRRLYARYLQHCLRDVLSSACGANCFYPVADEVVDILCTPDGLSVEVAGGRCFSVDGGVLAVGNMPPDKNRPPHYIGDPWSEAPGHDLDPTADVFIAGTGLSMVDVVLSLIEAGHTGVIHALSRRGLLPRPNAAERGLPAWRFDAPSPPTCVGLLRAMRAEVARADLRGRPWQNVIIGFRPHVQVVWQQMTFAERQRFFRHLRPWWEVHRHRMAPETAERIDRLTRAGRLRVMAGRIEDVFARERDVEVHIRRRGATEAETLRVARVINCSGPKADHALYELEFVRNSVARGHARTDTHGLGLDVDPSCALLDRSGRSSGRLFAVGPVTRGTFWEITAVPDIRRQCGALATRLLADQAIPATGSAGVVSGAGLSDHIYRPAQ